MAIRFDGTPDEINRSSDLLDYNSVYTVCFWFNIAAANSVILSLNNNNTNLDTIRTNATSNMRLRSGNSGASNVDGSTISTDTWYHGALVRDSATSLKFYLNGVQDIEHTVDITGRSSIVVMQFGAQNGAAYLNGRVAYVKAWTTNLVAAEIQAEMRSIMPVRLADLHECWPMFFGATERLQGIARGRNWTEAGTLTDEATPPVAYSIFPVVVFVPPAAGGTTYNQSASGALSFAGSLARQTSISPDGATSFGGVLARQTAKPLAGSLASAGSLARQAAKNLVGTLTSSGALAALRTSFASLSGAISPAGALTRATFKPLAGSLALSGILNRLAAKAFSGALSTAGALTRSTLKQLSGVLSLSGALNRATAKALTGALAFSGALSRATSKALAGALSFAGSLTKEARKILSGELTSSGELSVRSVFTKAITGALSFSGALARQTQKQLAGAVSPTGALGRVTQKVTAGAISFSGVVSKQAQKQLSGALSFAGSLAKGTAKQLSGALSFSGSLAKETHKVLAGSLSTTGNLSRTTLKSLQGTLTSAGALATELIAGVIQQAVGGVLSFSGDVKKKVKKSWPGHYRSAALSAGLLARRFPAFCLLPAQWPGLLPASLPKPSRLSFNLAVLRLLQRPELAF